MSCHLTVSPRVQFIFPVLTPLLRFDPEAMETPSLVVMLSDMAMVSAELAFDLLGDG